MKNKICSKCYISQSIDNYSKCCKNRDGYNNYCKVCAKEYNVKWQKNNKITKKYTYSRLKINPDKKSLTGSWCVCGQCNKTTYHSPVRMKKTNFCSNECWNDYQKAFKQSSICKICKQSFLHSKIVTSNRKYIYCSNNCLKNDKEFLHKRSVAARISQLNKKGLNKLETRGSEILNELGIKHLIQQSLFNKFIVDVFIPENNLVIQWDGEYWHSLPKRKKLDISQDKYLKKCGYRILRITDKQIKFNVEEVKNKILSFILAA